MLGFAADVMMAASFWSLLAPSIAISEHGRLPAWMPATTGLLLEVGCLYAIDKSLPDLRCRLDCLSLLLSLAVVATAAAGHHADGCHGQTNGTMNKQAATEMRFVNELGQLIHSGLNNNVNPSSKTTNPLSNFNQRPCSSCSFRLPSVTTTSVTISASSNMYARL